MSSTTVKIRLLFVNDGTYHHEDIQVPADAPGRYDRLIDLLREDPEVLQHIYVDLARLCAAQIVTE